MGKYEEITSQIIDLIASNAQDAQDASEITRAVREGIYIDWSNILPCQIVDVTKHTKYRYQQYTRYRLPCTQCKAYSFDDSGFYIHYERNVFFCSTGCANAWIEQQLFNSCSLCNSNSFYLKTHYAYQKRRHSTHSLSADGIVFPINGAEFIGEVVKKDFCDLCESRIGKGKIKQEEKRVKNNLSRTRVKGLTSTLTLTQWLRTLDYFSWSCAYCGGLFECIEHIIPVEQGGGTTQKNCLPSCRSCNSQKATMFSPPDMSNSFAKRIVTFMNA